MEFDQVLRGRRSTRAFRDDPIPDEVVREVLDSARWAPSWNNAQDWNITVVSGEKLRALKDAIVVQVSTELPSRTDIPMPVDWPEEIRARMNIQRPVAAAGAQPQAATSPSVWEAWGAPTLLLFAVDDSLAPEYACLDAGLLVQSVCLAAQDKGLSSCIMAIMVRHPQVLHALLPDTEHMRFVVGVALGLADPKSPINSVDRQRVELDEFVTWATSE